jgi:3'-phosphoadenosine 5'-phosphosulfate sulfotransferase (PAPS reductase)/FAD synthetase
MITIDNEFLLEDRIAKIRSIINYENQNNFYVSFSGGKDSTVLHHLIDLALPNNTIERIFFDTGIEYRMIKSFVKKLATNDNRIRIVKPEHGIGYCIKKYGYPFKNKYHSDLMFRWNKTRNEQTKADYIAGKHGKGKQIPKKLLYQYNDDFTLKISPKCCQVLKKDVSKNINKISILGMREEEKGIRALSYSGCVMADKNGKVLKFMPLFPMKDEWIDWFVDFQKIEICEIYLPPYNFKRTGCLGCPYNLKITQDLTKLYELLPKEYEKAIRLWKPVYDEYIRIGYRLKKYPHLGQQTLKIKDIKDELKQIK